MGNDVVSNLRHRECYFKYFGRDADKLDVWGVNMKLSDRVWQAPVVPLLDLYATQNGDGNIPDSFAIPSESP